MAKTSFRIGFVSVLSSSPWGGSEELWSQTAHFLAKAGHQVFASVQGWPQEHPAIRQLESAGVHVSRRFPAKKPEALANRIFRFFRANPSSPEERWLRRVRPTLLVISKGLNCENISWMKAARKLQVPYVPVVHAAAEWIWLPDEEGEEYGDLFSGARHVFFVSKANRELTELQFATRLENASVVRNPFKTCYHAQHEWPPQEDGLKLAFVGRLDSGAKGCDVLLQTLAMAKWKERPVSVTFFGTGKNAKGLRWLAHRLGLEHVEFAGHCADVGEIWKTHHALVLPSRYEGLPIVIVEAMLSHRPCIVSDVAGNPELIQDGTTGFVAKGPTVQFLDEALERAWNARATLREMGRAAGHAVRMEVPPDPARVFADRLLALAAN